MHLLSLPDCSALSSLDVRDRAAFLSFGNMPRCVGTAREVAEAAAVVHGLLLVASAAAVAPGVLQVVLPYALAADERWKGLKRRESQSWPVELSMPEVNLAREAAFPHVFYATFGCSPVHFEEIHSTLKMPAIVKTRCKKTCSGRTALLVVLGRLRSSAALDSLGRSLRMNPKRISAICTTTVAWVFGRWGHIPAMVSQLAGRFPMYAEAIERTSGIEGLLIAGFIDCTVRCCARPLYGQEALFSGHKKIHGLKYQALGFPDGLIAGLYGPRQARRHDSRVLIESGLQTSLTNIQRRTGLPYLIYGDPAYGNTTTIMAGFDRVQRRGNVDMDRMTKALNADRTSVEWCFGKVCTKFKWVESKDANSIGKTACGMYYQVAVFLTNCITCVEGGGGTLQTF